MLAGSIKFSCVSVAQVNLTLLLQVILTLVGWPPFGGTFEGT